MWHIPYAFWFLLVILQFIWVTACTSRPLDRAQVIATAFDGFVYVGSFPAVGYSPPPHSHETAKLLAFFEAGRLYVFHHVGPLDDAEFAVKELPKRLRVAGATVIEAPSSKAELPSIDPGDRAWRVVFKYAASRGTIYNVLDQDLFQRGGIKPGGNMNSFVLKFDPS